MPYHLSEDGLCVMKDGDEEPVKCHPDREAAMAHMRALMMNVPDTAKAGMDMEQAKMHLDAALKLHQAHMDGTEPTNESSQKKLMAHIKAALAAIGMEMPSGMTDAKKAIEYGTSALKAGARHSTGDIKKGRGVKSKAREIVQDMEDLGFPDEQQVGNPGDAPAAKGDDLPDVAITLPHFASVKAIGKRKLELKVAFGGPKSGKDRQGEFFDAMTDFDEENFPSPPVTHYHGFDKNGRPSGKPIFVGKTVKRETRADGHYLIVDLNNSRHADDIYNAALKGKAVVSPGTVPHLTRPLPRRSDGHLDYWPIAEIATWEYKPGAEPANPWSVASLPGLKSIYREAGLDLPALLNTNDSATPQATGTESPAEPSATNLTKGILDMDEKELTALLDRRDAERKAQEQAEIDRKAQEQTRIDAAVKAAEEKAAKELAAMKAQYVAAGRLPMGDPNGAPAQARFADTRKYDGLGMGDLAFAAGILDAVKRGDASNRGASVAMLKALAIKVAEDKTEIGMEGRGAMKAVGLDPGEVLNAAKADELNYSTQAGYGDEWVPTVWSPTLWQTVRALTFVLEKIPQRSYDVPGDTFTYPLEGADPTWYLIPQTTDIDSTNRRPNATIGDSKVATSSVNGTFSKVGARILFSGEFSEDSLIPWVPQLRAQTERSFAEQMEHLVIDGDTETAATTNINHIGGTPTNTGTKRDLFLALNGFRKSCLVTTTANSRSGSGTLVDTDFMETAWLLGAAGLIGGDPTKVDFIVDPNVSKKAAYLASVKTKDVFTTATLENGLLRAIWGYKVFTSWFMHWRSTTNPREANTAGKVDLTTQANNTTGAILAVRWDQWFFGYKRRMVMKLQDIPDSDAQQLIATARVGMLQRDTEGSAITYNVGI